MNIKRNASSFHCYQYGCLQDSDFFNNHCTPGTQHREEQIQLTDYLHCTWVGAQALLAFTLQKKIFNTWTKMSGLVWIFAVWIRGNLSVVLEIALTQFILLICGWKTLSKNKNGKRRMGWSQKMLRIKARRNKGKKAWEKSTTFTGQCHIFKADMSMYAGLRAP